MEELLAKLTTEEPSDTFAVTIKKLVDDAGQKDVYIVALENRLETIERAYEEAFKAREIEFADQLSELKEVLLMSEN